MGRRQPLLLVAAAAVGVAAAIACGSGGIEHLSDDGSSVVEDAGDSVVLGPDNKPAPTGPAGTGLVSGLPCDVQALVENRCLACHAGTQPGTPKLSEYADFLVPSKSDPTKTMAQIAVVRMTSTAANRMPPPPATPAAADEIQTMSDWVTGGTKKGGLCTDPPPRGGTDAGASDAGMSADGAPACLSGTMWAGGNTKSALMHPGVACSACHQAMGGPNLRFGGTVYRAPHDIDDCNGAAPPPTITVTVTDKFNRSLTATVNAAGNFDVVAQGQGPGSNRLMPPFKAKVSDGTNTRLMNGSVTSGDCNSCHSVAGINGAPGRIIAP